MTRPSLCSERIDDVKTGRVALLRQHCDSRSQPRFLRVDDTLSVAVAVGEYRSGALTRPVGTNRLAAGLHIAHSRTGLTISTPAPEHRAIGRVPRDYWDNNRFTKPYEAVIDPNQMWRDRPLDTLPHDPTTAAQA